VLEQPAEPPIEPESPLDEALRLTTGARQADYGHPLDDYTATGAIWGAMLTRAGWEPGTPIPAELATLMMVGVKLSRESGQHKRDNLVDAAGYVNCVSMIHSERERREGGIQNADA
jgi:hypothetical protein